MGKDDIMKDIFIHYSKLPTYRVYSADGVFGGLTPTNKLFMELFFDKIATPASIRYELKEPGKLGDEISREGKTGLMREIQCGIVMNIDTVIALRNWLNLKIDEYNERIKEDKENE